MAKKERTEAEKARRRERRQERRRVRTLLKEQQKLTAVTDEHSLSAPKVGGILKGIPPISPGIDLRSDIEGVLLEPYRVPKGKRVNVLMQMNRVLSPQNELACFIWILHNSWDLINSGGEPDREAALKCFIPYKNFGAVVKTGGYMTDILSMSQKVIGNFRQISKDEFVGEVVFPEGEICSWCIPDHHIDNMLKEKSFYGASGVMEEA